ncbi:YfhO family protein [Levilactobacillus tangyuanensis]|uniref:YfhO family protein n=1 Tax=Levilactobacillus tangyuanensis TaxID=2486021 RepID=A0ABW1TQB3_9LACO|nr:YfhO family protein [Levilactobacillus tangyuanensis]
MPVQYPVLWLYAIQSVGAAGLESKQAGYGRLGWFTLTGALSGLSAAAILLPTGLGMLLTAKGTANAINFRPVPEFGLEFFTQFGLGATNFTQRLMHAPTVFVSSAVALLVLTFFVNPMIGRRKKFATVTLLGMLFLGMWLRVFNTFWHLMQAPAGFPFRNVFFFSFVMVMVGYEAWIAEPRQISQGWQWVLPIGQVMIMVLGAGMMPLMRQLVSGHSPKLVAYYAKIQQVHWGSLWIGCLYVIVTALVLFMTQRALRQWTLAMLVTSELGGNFVLSMSTGKFGDQVKYAQAYAEENRHMAGVNDPDGQLYRVQNTNSLINQAYQTTYNNYNDSLLFNFHGIAGYSSTLNDRTRQTLHQLGLFSDNVRRVSDVGLTPVTEALLGVKSTVSLTPTRSQTTATTGYSGMGFAVPAGLTRVPLTMNASQNQEAILQAIRPSATHDVVPAKQLGDQVKVVHRVGGKVTKYHYHHVMTLMAKATGPVYLWAPNGETKYSTMTVNGHRVKPTSNANGHTALIKLGTFKRGQTMIVRVATKYATAIYHLEAVSFNQVQVNRALQMLKQNQLTATTKTSRWQTVINGQVTGTTRKDHLYLALADDTGWHVMINGQHVRTQRTLGGFMSVPITPGHNRVRLTYQVPGGRSGWLLSGIGVLDFSGLALWSRSKRKHKH